MKKSIVFFIFLLFVFNMFSIEQIGIYNHNVFSLDFTEDKLPVCVFYEEEEGLISIIKRWYIQIGKEIFGPYDSFFDPIIKNNTIIYAAGTEDNYHIYINGIDFANGYKITSQLQFLENEKTIIYTFENKGNKYINIGDEQIGPFDEIIDFIISNNKLLFYIIKENNNFYFISDEIKYGPFDDINDYKIGNNNSFAIIANKDGKEYLYNNNGLLAGPYGKIFLRDISSDGKKIAYQTFVNIDLDPFNSILWINYEIINSEYYFSDVYFLFDDSLMYKYQNNSYPYQYIHFGQQEYGPLSFDKIVLSNNKTFFAFTYRDSPLKHYLKVGNEITGPFETCGNIYFSPNDSKIVYTIKEKEYYYLVYKQNKFGPYKYINNVIFSIDSKDFAFISSENIIGSQKLHYNNIETPEYSYIFDVAISNNIMSYRAWKDGFIYNMVFVNGKEYIGRYKDNTLMYINNGKIIKE